MKFWNRNFHKIALASIVVFVLQVLLPTLSFAFPGFFSYSSSDGKLRGYVYVQDPTKVSVKITQNGSVTNITYDTYKDKISISGNSNYQYDDFNVKLKNVNFNQVEYTSNSAPDKIEASDGQTTQEFIKEIGSGGNARYIRNDTRVGYYRITGEQYVSASGAATYIPSNSKLVSFTPANNESRGIELRLPFDNIGQMIDFNHLAITDFRLRDVTAGVDLNLTGLNRLDAYRSIISPQSYYSHIMTLETAETLIKDHTYELKLSSTSNSDEIKLPVEGTYSFELLLGKVIGQGDSQGNIMYFFEANSATYFDNVQIKNDPQIKINLDTMYIGQNNDLVVFKQFNNGVAEAITDYEIKSLTYSDGRNHAISLDESTHKVTAIHTGAASLVLSVNGIMYLFTINVVADTEKPVWSNDSNVSISNVTTTRGTLSWTGASDRVGVVGYKIYSFANGVYSEIATVNGAISYNFTNLISDTSYTLAIKAVDSAGNWSEYSPSVTFRTVKIPVVVGGGGGGSTESFSYVFEDQDPIRGQIQPRVSWFTSSESNYSGYQLIFSNAAGVAISQSFNVNKQASPRISYKVDIAGDQVPVGAVYLDLLPKDLTGNTGSVVYRMQIFDNTTNSSINTVNNSAIPAPVFQEPEFEDINLMLGGLGGSISWYDASTDASPATSYSIYFVDANNEKLKSIAEIPRYNFKRPNQYIDLPSYEITFVNGLTMPTGAQRIGIFGKNAQGESTTGYYFGFWDKIAGTLGNDYFEDSDNRANHINGVLHWAPMLNEANIQGYEMQFVGSTFRPIGTSFAQIIKGQQEYRVSIQDNQIPADAKAVVLLAVNTDQEYLDVGYYNITDNVGGESVTSLSVDHQLPGIFQILSYDVDGEVGELGGDFRFYPNPSAWNSAISRYDIYFVNEQLQKLQPIISLAKNDIGVYQSSIPMNTKVANGATKLAIYGITASGESVPATINLDDRVYSPSLETSQINITNNKSDSFDSITVSGLQANDAISVYRDATSLNSFLVGSVEQNASSISFTVPQLGQEAGKLYFTLQRSNGTRSLKVEKTYVAETIAAITPPPAVGGGGGGGGPVEAFKWDIVNKNGTVRITSSIDPDQIRKLSEEQSKAGKREIPIDLKTKADGYDFQINAGLIDEIKSKKVDAILVLNTTLGTARIPFDVLQEAMKENGGSNKMSLKVSIDALPSVSQQDLEKTIASIGGASVGKALSYELSLMDNNKTVATIDSFSQFIGHILLLPKDFKLNSGEKLSGAVWDPKTNELVSVPLTFTPEKDGNPAYATLWKKGNSIYTVYKSEKHFADVKDDYFAKADVESLASSHVIQGFEDGSFRADASVTRAEFATLLGRGLGLKSANNSYKGFSDVKSEDWFSQAVLTAVSSGLINGYEDETFRPNQSITHQEAITMISNALKFINSASKLDDSDRAFYVGRMNELALKVDDWASDSTALALKRNVLNTSNGFSFKKDSNTTRGEAALLINQLLQNASWPDN